MFRTDLKIRILGDGRVEIIDPDLETLPLFKAIAPKFRIKKERLQNFTRQRLMSTRTIVLPYREREIREVSTEILWTIHEDVINDSYQSCPNGEVSLLDLKIELARRALENCRLCGRQCSVDRHSGKRGYCGLGVDSKVGECFVHIAEEAPVNPSINVNLIGCGLKCRFCQKHELINPEGSGKCMDAFLWHHLRSKVARSLSFVGGNPDESIYAILRFLKGAPSWFRKPIVWNSNGYASRIVYRLLNGIADAYTPDMKFYGNECSRELAGCSNYFDMFEAGIDEMVKQDVPVFVRMLVLPGHLECCHRPLIDHLAKYRERVKLNVMGQYYPDFLVAAQDLSMGQRPLASEFDSVRSYAERRGGREWLI